MRALAFIIRMNYILDTDLLKVRLGLPPYMEKLLAGYKLSYRDTIGMRSNVTWAHSSMYSWERVLSCTVRVFVNLTFPLFGEKFRMDNHIG